MTGWVVGHCRVDDEEHSYVLQERREGGKSKLDSPVRTPRSPYLSTRWLFLFSTFPPP